MKLTKTQYHELRNAIFESLVSNGTLDDSDETFSAFDDALGSVEMLEVDWDDDSEGSEYPKLVKTKDITYSGYLYNVAEGYDVLKMRDLHFAKESAIELDSISFGECRFERKSDWMRLINKLNSYDETPLRRYFLGDKKSVDHGPYTLTKTTIEHGDDGLIVEFKEPIEVYTGEVGDETILTSVKRLRGKLDWDWFFTKGGREELDGYANICSVFLNEVELLD